MFLNIHCEKIAKSRKHHHKSSCTIAPRCRVDWLIKCNIPPRVQVFKLYRHTGGGASEPRDTWSRHGVKACTIKCSAGLRRPRSIIAISRSDSSCFRHGALRSCSHVGVLRFMCFGHCVQRAPMPPQTKQVLFLNLLAQVRD